MRYAVTGAAGFIGSHLARELLRRGNDVVGFDSFTDYYDPRLKRLNAEGLDIRELDLAADEIDLTGFDGVFHLAGQPGVRSFGDVFALYVNRNVLATHRLYEAAIRAGARVVFASSSSVYGDAETYPTPESTPTMPVSPYGITKLTCEQLAHAYRRNFTFDAVVVRYFTVYGPGQRPDMAFTRLVTALASGAPFELYGDGNQSRGFTFVADAVDATILAMEHGLGTYNIGGADEATMNDVIALLEEISGRKMNVVYKPVAKGDVQRTNADTTAIRELGWTPSTPLRQGLELQWQWAEALVEARGSSS